MDRTKNYIQRFYRSVRINRRYSMRASELFDFAEEVSRHNVCDTICTIFEYGYAKGYRACQSEMKNIGQEG